MKQRFLLITLILFALTVAACGSVATPAPSSEDATRAAEEAGTDEEAEVVAAAPSQTPVPPTATATSVPPTPTTPPPTPTDAPAEEEATSAPAQAQDPLVLLVSRFGNPARGDELFHTVYNNTSTGPYACSTCHNAASEDRLIGPGLYNLRDHADQRVEGQVAEAYIYNSILHPNDFIVPAEPPYPANLMPNNYRDLFSDQDLYDIIAYILTLGD